MKTEEEEDRTAVESSFRNHQRRSRKVDFRRSGVKQPVRICVYILPADSWCVAHAPAVCGCVAVYQSELSVLGLSPPAGAVESLQPAGSSAACFALIGCHPPHAADAPAPLITNSNDDENSSFYLSLFISEVIRCTSAEMSVGQASFLWGDR